MVMVLVGSPLAVQVASMASTVTRLPEAALVTLAVAVTTPSVVLHETSTTSAVIAGSSAGRERSTAVSELSGGQ